MPIGAAAFADPSLEVIKPTFEVKVDTYPFSEIIKSASGVTELADRAEAFADPSDLMINRALRVIANANP